MMHGCTQLMYVFSAQGFMIMKWARVFYISPALVIHLVHWQALQTGGYS